MSSRLIPNIRTICPISLFGFNDRVSDVAIHYRYLPAANSSENQYYENLLRVKVVTEEGLRHLASYAPTTIIDENATEVFICRIRSIRAHASP